MIPAHWPRAHVSVGMVGSGNSWGSFRAQCPILQCNSGNRSRQLAEQTPGEWHHLDGGIQAWKRAGLPVEADRQAPLPIMRQVQIAAGSLVLLGQILAWLVAPAFGLLSAFVGAGLIFAGITGTCGMAKLLGRLPYNQPRLARRWPGCF